jgi:hypothetical protein
MTRLCKKRVAHENSYKNIALLVDEDINFIPSGIARLGS